MTKSRILIGLGIILAIAAVGAAFYFGFRTNTPDQKPAVVKPNTVPVTRGTVKDTVTGPGTLNPTQQTGIVSVVNGRLSDLNVKAGDPVKKGQVLARIGGREKFAAAVAEAKLKVSQARQNIDDLTSGAPLATAQAQKALKEAEKAAADAKKARQALNYPRAGQTTIQAREADYNQALTDVALAQDSYDKVANLPAEDYRRNSALQVLVEAQKRRDSTLATLNWLQGKPNATDFSDADIKSQIADAALSKAQADWARVQNGADALKLEAANLSLQNAEAQLAEAEADLNNLDLTAPFDGVVIAVKSRQGDWVTAGFEIMTLTAPSSLEVQATVVEEDFPLVKVGQKVDLYFDARPDITLTGKVARIIPQRTAGDRALYPVYISLDETSSGLVQGMTVDASINIDSRANVLTLPRSLVKARSDGTAKVEVWSNGIRETREIKIGLRGDQAVEILDGLAEGEEVVAK